MYEFTAIAVLSVLLVTLIPVLKQTHWLVRGWDFPRLQLLSVSALLVIAQLFFLEYRQGVSPLLLAFTTACLLCHCFWVLPYTIFWPKEVELANSGAQDRELSILSANVYKNNRNAPALIKLVNQYEPDVLLTLETDSWWEKALMPLEGKYPYSLKCPLDNLYGMHLYSQVPLQEESIDFLVEKDIPSMHVTVALKNGINVRMHLLHPSPPSPAENRESAERDAELIMVARSVSEYDGPVIVAGDLNDVAWSSTTRLFRKISGLLDPRIGRGMFNTFHARLPLVRWPLDHLFHSGHFAVADIARLPAIGSDHFPLFARLTYLPGVERESQLEALPGDEERADAITDALGVDASQVPAPADSDGPDSSHSPRLIDEP